MTTIMISVFLFYYVENFVYLLMVSQIFYTKEKYFFYDNTLFTFLSQIKSILIHNVK